MALKSCRICGIFGNQLQPQPTLAVPGTLPPSIPQGLRVLCLAQGSVLAVPWPWP